MNNIPNLCIGDVSPNGQVSILDEDRFIKCDFLLCIKFETNPK